MSTALPGILAITLYAASTLIQWLRIRKKEFPKGLVQLLTLFGAAAQCLSVHMMIHSARGIDLNFYATFSLSSWMVILIILASSMKKPVENLLIVLLPVSMITIAAGLLFHNPSVILENHSFGMVAHIIISILAYSTFMVAAVQALLLAYQEKHLKSHNPVGIIRAFPPMQTMEKLLFEFIWAGYILLSIGLATGFIYLNDMFVQHVAHKTILGILAWCLFSVLLLGQKIFGWRGQTAIRWTLSGFFILLLAYFGSRFVVDLVLN